MIIILSLALLALNPMSYYRDSDCLRLIKKIYLNLDLDHDQLSLSLCGVSPGVAAQTLELDPRSTNELLRMIHRPQSMKKSDVDMLSQDTLIDWYKLSLEALALASPRGPEVLKEMRDQMEPFKVPKFELKDPRSKKVAEHAESVLKHIMQRRYRIQRTQALKNQVLYDFLIILGKTYKRLSS